MSGDGGPLRMDLRSSTARTEMNPSSKAVSTNVPSLASDPKIQGAPAFVTGQSGCAERCSPQLDSLLETVREEVADGRLSVSAVTSSLGPKKRVHFPVQYTTSPVPGRQSASLVYPSRGSFSLTESRDMRSSIQPMQQRATIDAASMIAPVRVN